MSTSKLVYEKFLLRKDEVVSLQLQGTISFHNEGSVPAVIHYSDDNEQWQTYPSLAPNDTVQQSVKAKYLKIVTDTEVYCLVVEQNNVLKDYYADNVSVPVTTTPTTNSGLNDKSLQPLVDAIVAKLSNPSTEQTDKVTEFVNGFPQSLKNLIVATRATHNPSNEGVIIQVSDPDGLQGIDITKIIDFSYGNQPLGYKTEFPQNFTDLADRVTINASYQAKHLDTLVIALNPAPSYPDEAEES